VKFFEAPKIPMWILLGVLKVIVSYSKSRAVTIYFIVLDKEPLTLYIRRAG